jgi:hypothetical protein
MLLIRTVIILSDPDPWIRNAGLRTYLSQEGKLITDPWPFLWQLTKICCQTSSKCK